MRMHGISHHMLTCLKQQHTTAYFVNYKGWVLSSETSPVTSLECRESKK